MVKTKLISVSTGNYSSNSLDFSINEFISKLESAKIIDIKFSATAIASSSYNQHFNALIIYEENVTSSTEN